MNEIIAAETAVQVAEDAAAELTQQMVEEEAKEKAAEEWLRKKAAATKKKKKVAALSNQLAIDITEDIYFAAFHVGAPFEILGDPESVDCYREMEENFQQEECANQLLELRFAETLSYGSHAQDRQIGPN